MLWQKIAAGDSCLKSLLFLLVLPETFKPMNFLPKRYTVTTALPYANGPLHIGHLAGVYIPADAYVRYLRLKGEDVLFVGGSDEHGVPITLKARNENISPQEVVDKYHHIIKSSFEKLGISFDIYSRTSSPVHHQTSSAMFKKMFDDGCFQEKSTKQYYDSKAKQFLADRYIKGTCPSCAYEEAYGDQCEKCGTSLSPSDLKNPKSMLSGEVPVLKETKHWYLPLDEYEPWLCEWILKENKDWRANVYGQCKSWLDSGLQPRAMTRDLDWGVKVPVAGVSGKVLYVWFDAPIGYISAAKEWSQQTGKDWEPYWKNNDTKLVHFIGKDNIVFHCIIFPVILKAHGGFILPKNVPANEFLNLEGSKLSTSRNWAVWLHEYLEDLPGKEDVLRYVLTANAPETKDSDFTWVDFQARNNNELIAIFGNFVNRVFVLTHKYFEAQVPELGDISDYDREVIGKYKRIPAQIAKRIEKYKFREAQALMMDMARLGNKYLADTEPWKVIKKDKRKTGTILNIGLQMVASLSIVAEPFIPNAATEIKKILNLKDLTWLDAGRIELLKPGNLINKPTLLFEKIEDQIITAQQAKLKKPMETNNENKVSFNLKPEITFDDFVKLDIRIATILEAEKIPQSKKLLKIKVDLGGEQRTVLSGISEHYSPEEIVGKQVSLLANLSPRKMMGIDSQGMILMAEDENGKLSFIAPEENMRIGTAIS